jgi:hypothetical protein
LDHSTIDQDFDLRNSPSLDTVSKLLIAKGISLQKDSRGSVEKDRLNDDQSRLEKIVKEGFDAIDALIHDDSSPPLGLRRKERVNSGNSYLMSGALVTGGGKTLDEIPTNDIRGFSNSPVIIRHHCIKPDYPEPVFAPILDDKASEVESTIVVATSSNTTPTQASPYRHSHIIETKESKQDGNCNLIQSGSSQTEGTPTRRQTPIPAPEPWRGVGLANPFGDNSLPALPSNRRQPSQPRASGMSTVRGSSDTYLCKLQESSPKFLSHRFEPMSSSPLKRRSLRIKAKKAKQGR